MLVPNYFGNCKTGCYRKNIRHAQKPFHRKSRFQVNQPQGHADKGNREGYPGHVVKGLGIDVFINIMAHDVTAAGGRQTVDGMLASDHIN